MEPPCKGGHVCKYVSRHVSVHALILFLFPFFFFFSGAGDRTQGLTLGYCFFSSLQVS
jgi:hypothetical protein